MTALLFDAAYKPDLAAVKAAGGIAMSVYLTGDYANTCAQPVDLHAAGLGSLGNYEQAADELTWTGQAGGVAIGQKAAEAYIGKGAPANAGLGIAFSADVNVAPADYPKVGAAITGVKQGMAGRFVTLLYGQGGLIDYLVTEKIIGPGEWLAAPTSWPGFNAADPNVALVQQVGTPVTGTDEDEITNLDAVRPFIWWPDGSPYANGVVDMALAPEVQAEFDKVLAAIGAERMLFRTTEPDGKTVVTGTVERINELHVEQPLAALLHQVLTNVAALQTAVDNLAAQVAAQHNTVGVTGSLTLGPVG